MMRIVLTASPASRMRACRGALARTARELVKVARAGQLQHQTEELWKRARQVSRARPVRSAIPAVEEG
jgi:hypothetical protein